MSNENNPVTELSSGQSNPDNEATSRVMDSAKKHFVEPVVSVPLDVLEATAFFQGSAALDVADL